MGIIKKYHDKKIDLQFLGVLYNSINMLHWSLFCHQFHCLSQVLKLYNCEFYIKMLYTNLHLSKYSWLPCRQRRRSDKTFTSMK
jgi:hypothetical protein